MKEISNEQLFIHVVESGSFKKAAELLAMDPSLVSRRISSLEKRLGVKLLQRSTKNSFPTEVGEQYFVELQKLLEEQNALENRIKATVNEATGHLKVAAPHDFGTFFISDILENMVERYPQLTVELVLGSQFENLAAEGIDVAVRIGKLPDSSLICRRIGEVPRVLVASPEYIAQQGEPRSVLELEQHKFVFYKRSQMYEAVTIAGQRLHLSGSFVVNSVSAIRQWVLNGKGIHLGPVWAFRDALDTGALQRILPEVELQSFPLHAIYVSRAYVPAKVRLFIDLLSNTLSGNNFQRV